MDEIDTLSNLIRVMDPEHKMGAGALAETIVESGWMSDHDREVRAQAMEDMAKRVRADWAKHGERCPWVGALDDEAERIRKGWV